MFLFFCECEADGLDKVKRVSLKPLVSRRFAAWEGGRGAVTRKAPAWANSS